MSREVSKSRLHRKATYRTGWSDHAGNCWARYLSTGAGRGGNQMFTVAVLAGGREAIPRAGVASGVGMIQAP